MKIMMVIALMFVAAQGLASIDCYDELISRTAAACNDQTLFSSSFTNDLVRYRNATTNMHERCVADLAISLFCMHRYDKCLDTDALMMHNTLVSNVFYNASISSDSWIRYAAGFEYVNGLNIDGNSEGLVITTNLVASATSSSPNMATPNFWDAMMNMADCPGATVLDVFRLNAAIELYEKGEYYELGTYTNALPSRIYQYYLEEIE